MEIPRLWRTRHQRMRIPLEGEICPKGHKIFPPRDICPDCGNEAHDLYKFSGNGKVYSHTTVYEAPTKFQENTPFVEALVDLDEGPRLTAQLTDLSTHTETQIIDGEEREVTVFDVKIGMPVEAVTRKVSEDGEWGIINYDYKFRPKFGTSLPTEASMSSK